MIFYDIWYPTPIFSTNNSKHSPFLNTHGSILSKLNLKALSCSVHFKNTIENQLDLKIKYIQINGGKEYVAFSNFAGIHGITHRFSCPHIDEQNDSAERKHRHITKVGFTLLANASVSLKCWG